VHLKDGKGLDINVTNNHPELLLRMMLDFSLSWLFMEESLVISNRTLFFFKKYA
jgi:hypothetical protein